MLKTLLNKFFKKCDGCKKVKWGVKARSVTVMGYKATIKNQGICRACAKKVEKGMNPERNWGKQDKWN